MKRTSKRTNGSRRSSPVRGARKAPPSAGRAPNSARGDGAASALGAFAEVVRPLQARWYLFGAVAVAIHGVPRTTADIDVTVDLGERSASELLAALSAAGFQLRPEAPEDLAAARVIPVLHVSSGWRMDVVLAGPGIEELFAERAELRMIGRRKVPVISPDDLIATKVLAARPKDLEDIRGLLRIATIDRPRLHATIATLEAILDQSDLRPLLDQLEREAKQRR